MELRIISQFTFCGIGFCNILKLIYGLFVSGYRVCTSSNLLTSEYFSSTKNFYVLLMASHWDPTVYI